ncbi:MAG: hypothetical protein H0V09_09610 [Gemmatimonadetes bacterium]|nr:hypothetical protein [Gemmatimonadota bacterium]
MIRPALFALPLAALLAACSEPESEPASRWPARNYSGSYAVRAKAASNECPAAIFAAGDTVEFRVLQEHDNRATVVIQPVISLSGVFQGDRLQARAAVVNTALAAANAAPGKDSTALGVDSLRYTLDLRFEGEVFEGTYRVDQPALGGGFAACSQTFDVEGRLWVQPQAGGAASGSTRRQPERRAARRGA